MSRARAWSLQGRMTLWFAATVAGVLIAVSALSVLYLDRQIDRELDALAQEELHEFEATWETAKGSADPLLEVTAILAAQHPSNALAWRVRSSTYGSRLGDVDPAGLLEDLPEELGPLGVTLHHSPRRVSRSGLLAPDMLVEVVIDGTAQRSTFRSYLQFLAALGVTTLLAGLLVGALLGRRVGGLLRQVARNLEYVGARDDPGSLAPHGAPSELQAVATQLSTTLALIERERERTRVMTTGLAHELRSPLQTLLGTTEVALLREREPSEYQRVLRIHFGELRDLSRVVDNLITLSSTSTGEERSQEDVDIASELELHLMKERSQAEQKGIVLTTHVDGDVTLRGDRESLLLAVRNLLSNALDWSPSGSEVRLAVTADATHVQVSVDDSGPGVPEAERELVFTPFFTSLAREGRRAGYGLGLALARTVFESHGGTISVQDSELGGARFLARIPRPAPSHIGESQ